MGWNWTNTSQAPQVSGVHCQVLPFPGRSYPPAPLSSASPLHPTSALSLRGAQLSVRPSTMRRGNHCFWRERWGFESCGNLGKDVGKTVKHGVSRCFSWEMCQRNREKTLGGYHQIALYYTDLYGLQIVMCCEGVTTAVGGEYVLVLARLLHRCQTFVISRKWLSCWFQWGYGVGLLALHRVWNQFDCGASMTQQLPYSLTTSSSPIYACCIQGGAPSVVGLEYSL